MQIVLTPDIILAAYRHGIFPMAQSVNSPYVHWVCPEMRGQLSISDMHIPKSLKKILRQARYDIRINTAFETVIRECAKITPERSDSWINEQIIDAFCTLHKSGHAHSVEYWQGGALRGGLYGIALGGAFFGESMFSRSANASKVALVHLAARLNYAGFIVLDTQFKNDHLAQFGVYDVSHKDYMRRLESALKKTCLFDFSTPDEKMLVRHYMEKPEQAD